MSCFVFDAAHLPGFTGYWENNSWVGNTTFFPGGGFLFIVHTLTEWHDEGWDSYANPWAETPCRPEELPVTVAVPFDDEPDGSSTLFEFWIELYDTVTHQLMELPGSYTAVIFSVGDNSFVVTPDWSGVPDTSHIARIVFQCFLYPNSAYSMTVGDNAQEQILFWTNFNKTTEQAE